VLVLEATPAAAFPPTASAVSGPVSWASASADAEEDNGEELAPQTPPPAPVALTVVAVLGPVSWASASTSADDDEDDEEKLAPQTPPPSPAAPSAMPRPASWAKAVDEDEAKLASATLLAASMTCAADDVDEKIDTDMMAASNCLGSIPPVAAAPMPRLQCVKSSVQCEMEEREEGWVKVGRGGRPS
jgi:hypothetical protein